MANTLRFKRGIASGIPTALAGEPLFTTDTFDLYIGNGTTNTRFQKYIASGATTQILRGDGSLYTFPLAISSPTTGQVLKYNGTSWVNDSDSGITGSGTTNYLSKFTGATTLGNSLVFDNGTSVGIGTPTPDYRLTIQAANLSTLALIDSAEATDQKRWVFQYGTTVGTGTFRLRAINDANTNGQNAYIITRTGIAVDTHQWLTAGSERARIFATGNFGINTGATDSGQKLQVVGTGYFSDSVGIGTTPLGNVSLLVSKNLSTPGVSYGIHQNGSASVTFPIGIGNTPIIAASATVNGYRSFYTANPSIGAGATVAELVGYFVESNFFGGTATYGFQSAIPSGTGRWNLYMNGTAANYLAGSLSIGSTANNTGYLRNYSTIPVLALQNPTTGTGTSDGLQLSVSGSLAYIWQYENAAMLFGTNATERMRIDSSGNLGLGVTPSAWSGGGAALQLSNGASLWTLNNQNLMLSQNSYFNGSSNIYIASAPASQYQQSSGTHIWRIAPSGTAGNAITFTQAMTLDASGNLGLGTTTPQSGTGFTFMSINGSSYGALSLQNGGSHRFSLYNDGSNTLLISIANNGMVFGTNGTERMRVTNTGNILIGSTTDSGEKLQVTGTAKITGNLTVDTNTLFVDATNNRVGIGTASPGQALEVNGYITSVSGGVSTFLGYDGTGSLAGTTSNHYFRFITNNSERVRITSTGDFGIGMVPSYKLDVTGSARVSDAIAIGTTPDTNNPFKILKNINATVGIKFENTNTSSLAFSAVQLGTDVSGGTKFTNLVYASSGVTASGVYNPDGTSLINNGNGGLNFLGNPIRMYTGGSNGVLRWDISNEGIIQYNATSPTTSATDAYKQYSADVTAGNAAPHFRTENGAVIKLYQETTSVGNSIFLQGGGNSVLDDSTFDGYTLRQIVKALRNQGILQ